MQKLYKLALLSALFFSISAMLPSASRADEPVVDPCLENPQSAECLNQNPDPEPDPEPEVDPCVENPESQACLDQQEEDEPDPVVDPCLENPESQACLDQQEDEEGDDPVDPCVENPEAPQCVEQGDEGEGDDGDGGEGDGDETSESDETNGKRCLIQNLADVGGDTNGTNMDIVAIPFTAPDAAHPAVLNSVPDTSGCTGFVGGNGTVL